MPFTSHGLTALTLFFVFGAMASGTAAITLLFPRTPLDFVWGVNLRGHAGLLALGIAGPALMAAVCAACAFAAHGIRIRAAWGRGLAVTILVVNLIGDTFSAWILGDPRTLIGLPIGGLLIAFLLSSPVKNIFRSSQGAL
jgi:hypothetical protein